MSDSTKDSSTPAGGVTEPVDVQPNYEVAARALGYQQIPNGTWFHPNQHPNFTERFKTAENIFSRYFGKHWPAASDAAPVSTIDVRGSLARIMDFPHDGNASSQAMAAIARETILALSEAAPVSGRDAVIEDQS